ncbi:MAG: DUF1599 domain-containing protein [Candidatus Pacebacteria bacterium]|nr:DUF1599 domain-containing protein [Candidatus Paceibacterota bacterium]
MSTPSSTKPKYLDQAFEQVLEEMLETFIKKYRDYGKGNILDTREMGILFRVKDKVNRLNHLLANNKKPVNESIEENWREIAVYAVIAMILKRGWFEKLELSPQLQAKQQP